MKKEIRLILVILWMGLIFYMSSCSGNTSSSQSNIIVTFVMNIFNISNSHIDIVSLIVRKLAHITEYFILCLLVINYLKTYNIKINKLLIYSFIICYLYACSDEIHQMFSDNRGPSFIDTLIDSIGIITSILITKITYKKKGKIK